MSEDEQRAFCGEHVDVYASQAADAVAPDACGVNDQIGVDALEGSCPLVAQSHTADPLTGHVDGRHFVVGHDVGSVALSCNSVGCRQPERVDSPVGHFYRPYNLGVDGRLDPPGFSGVDYLGTDTCVAASVDKSGLIGEVVVGKCYENAPGVFDAVAGNRS